MTILYTTDPIPKNYFGMLELQWSARVAHQEHPARGKNGLRKGLRDR